MTGHHGVIAAAVLAALAGLLTGLAEPPHDASALAWFALAPLLLALRGGGPVRGGLLGAIFGVGFALVTALWVTESLESGFAVGPVAARLFTLGLLGYGVVGFTAFGALAAPLSNHLFGRLAGAPAAWIAVEWARSEWFDGLPWLLLGHTQHETAAVLQWAEWVGVLGVGGIVVFANACLAEAWRGWWSEDDPARQDADRAAAVGVGSVVLVFTIGAARLASVEGVAPVEAPLRVGLVQAAVPQHERWDEAYRARNLDRQLALTREAVAAGAAVVVWGETAVGVFLDDPSELAAQVASALGGDASRTALVGVPMHDDTDVGETYANSVLAIDGDGRVTGRYDKIALLPIMERDPTWLGQVPGVGAVIGPLVRGDPYQAGESPAPLYAAHATAGILVCFESNLPGAARDRVESGARLLVNLSNDAFLMPAGAQQHFAQAVFRSVETRTPLVRVANRGVTALVTHSGRVVARTNGEEPGVTVVDVRLRDGAPPGGALAAGLPWLACLVVVAAAVRRRRD